MSKSNQSKFKCEIYIYNGSVRMNGNKWNKTIFKQTITKILLYQLFARKINNLNIFFIFFVVRDRNNDINEEISALKNMAKDFIWILFHSQFTVWLHRSAAINFLPFFVNFSIIFVVFIRFFVFLFPSSVFQLLLLLSNINNMEVELMNNFIIISILSNLIFPYWDRKKRKNSFSCYSVKKVFNFIE